jgi:hypothetical protein
VSDAFTASVAVDQSHDWLAGCDPQGAWNAMRAKEVYGDKPSPLVEHLHSIIKHHKPKTHSPLAKWIPATREPGED